MSPGVLYIVASPIGNLEDLSLRAARILREVDVIAAEDTRAAHRLLAAADAHGPVNPRRKVVSSFEGNEAARAEELGAALAGGAKVEVIPGPSASLAALVASGLPTDRFLFLGFPPRTPGARHQLFGGLRGEPATLILYEAPDRVGATLADLAGALGGDRRACVSRELTKIHEEHVRGTLAELAARYAEVAPRGECTLVVAGASAAPPVIDIEGELRRLLGDGLGPRDAAARLVIATGKPRRELYQLALAIQREAGRPGPGDAE